VRLSFNSMVRNRKKKTEMGFDPHGGCCRAPDTRVPPVRTWTAPCATGQVSQKAGLCAAKSSAEHGAGVDTSKRRQAPPSRPLAAAVPAAR